MKLKDWQERTIKTFVQSFLGTLIPALAATLENDIPKSWAAVAPMVVAALSSAICAAWNIVNEHLKGE